MLLLYHGSNQEISSIDLSRCRPYKDFGRGFYLTTLEKPAKLMAKRTAKVFSGSPIVTVFTYFEVVGSVLSVKAFGKPSAEWALFVLNNRSRDFKDFANPNSNHDNKYDIVSGPAASDDTAMLLRAYSNGYIDLNAMENGLKNNRFSEQYSFHTEYAVSFLNKIGAIPCE